MALADSTNHFVILLLLRWRLLINALRHANRRAEFALQTLLAIVLGGCVLIFSGFFFGVTYGLLHTHRADIIDLLLLALFLIWQFAPILIEGYSPGLNFREVARYPISFRTYFLLNLAYGMFDPAALACLLWLLSIWLAVLIKRPDLALAAAFAFLLFILFNLLCNRIVVGLFERFQSTRKGRERLVLIMLVLLLLPQLLQFSARGWAEGHAFRLSSTWLLTIRHTRDILPSGLTAHIFLLTGTASLAALAGLLVLAGIIFLLLLRQLRAVYQGEIYSEGYVVRRELIVRPGWQLPAVDSLTSAIMEKELRYLRQNSRLLLQLISMPVIFLLLMFNGPARKFSFATQPAGLLAGLAGFLLLSLPNVAYNIFGMENQAFGRWLLSPIPLRKVLLTKNMIHGGILTLLYGLVAIFVFAIGHVDLLQVATVTAGFFAGLILQLGAGNLFSVYWPKRVDLAQMSSRMTSSTAGFTSLLIILPFTAVYGMAIFAAKFWHLPWLPLALSLATLAVELKLYSYVLNRTVDYTYDHIEEIAGNLNT